MKKHIKVIKSYLGTSVSIVFFDKINIFLGRTDSIGIGINYCTYEKSLTFEILNLYAGIEVWNKEVWPEEVWPEDV